MGITVRKAFDEELIQIRDAILRMTSLVDKAVEHNFRAFKSHDHALAQESIYEDDKIDNLHNEIEYRVAMTVARQQPTARDLRVLIADLLISNELERMGDHALGMSKTIFRQGEVSGDPVPAQLSRMEKRVREMLNSVSEAYVDLDPDKAKASAAMDEELDTLYRDLFHQTVARMSAGEITVERGTYLLWTGHNLERIGDRVTNICERIVYARTGDIDKLNVKPDPQSEEV